MCDWKRYLILSETYFRSSVIFMRQSKLVQIDKIKNDEYMDDKHHTNLTKCTNEIGLSPMCIDANAHNIQDAT